MANEPVIQRKFQGSHLGKFFCHRNHGAEYLHHDGSWQESPAESAYFESVRQIEKLLESDSQESFFKQKPKESEQEFYYRLAEDLFEQHH